MHTQRGIPYTIPKSTKIAKLASKFAFVSQVQHDLRVQHLLHRCKAKCGSNMHPIC